MINIQYSTKQREVVESTEGAMAVVAAAGSGKTRILTGRIAHLIENVSGSYRILALTFTNKAADEMKTRLSIIPNINERVFIGTIHSFCINILREKGHVIGFAELPHIFEREQDRLDVVTEVLKRNRYLSQYYVNKTHEDQRNLAYKAIDYISECKRNLLCNILDNEEELRVLYQDYNELLREQNAIDYDDIILLAHKIFTERPKITELYRRLYKYICVDEAQDLNFAQYEFIKTLCGTIHKNVLMVGDDKQAIFGFNGSDKKYFTVDFIDEFNAKKIELTENYRSSKAVIRVANSIYPNSNDETQAVFTGGFHFYAAETEIDEAEYVVKKIRYYTEKMKRSTEIEGDVTFENVCIIARNRYIFKNLEEILNEKKIPYYFKRGSDTVLYETDPLRLFDLGIRIILNPHDRLHLRQMIQLYKSAYDTGNVNTFTDLIQKIGESKEPIYSSIPEAWSAIDKDNKDYRKSLDIIRKSIQQSDKAEEEKLMIYNEIENAKMFWSKYCGSASPDMISIQGFISNLALGMVNVPRVKEKGLALATVHSIKGLEYDIVFVIGLNEGSFPDYRAVKAGGKALEEEKNETYVAVTRAKRFLHLSYPKTKLMPWDEEKPYPQKISRFLKHLPL